MSHPPSLSHSLSRRRLLAGTGTLAAAATGLVTGCSPEGAPGTTQTKAKSGTITWWDQFLPKEKLERSFFSKFHADGGPKVDYTVYNPNEQGRALQLAKQSKQMPDVFTLAGLQTAAIALQEGGWFQPLADPDAIVKNLPAGTIVEGLHRFDGKLYSFPLGTFRMYVTLPWGNRSLLDKADIDVDDGPQSFDDFRAKVRRAQQKTGTPGLLLNLAFLPRMANFVHDLAQNAGFPGGAGMEYATGAYNYHHQAYLDALDFLLSFQKDKLLLPASSQLDARKGRARWVAGDAVWFVDGPFNAGVVKTDYAAFVDKLAVTQLPTAEGDDPVVTNGPLGGDLWISADSPYVEECSTLLAQFTSEEFRIGQAEAMDGGPIDLSVVPDSDAHPTFKQCCAWYEQFGKLAPSAVARNPEVARVDAKAKDVKPDLGAIVQGAFSGDVTDLPAALKKLSDDSERSREAAIKAAGSKVGTDAWAFPDWVRGQDYTSR
ncbi:ABC transporter substrate-binding protein [Microlunatus soli]|uniref:Multiple sugar transport system substrate-binding protein n=1 Tax=Microlunatus soli TaxID=630515 RepID=A0A1H2AP50_9ACTN|nr:ABC transporter substrate-binding protein [Microlunatus soli]SDT47607.1 multiple sugar transport system substrate-binding protein [Microlunatus soli]